MKRAYAHALLLTVACARPSPSPAPGSDGGAAAPIVAPVESSPVIAESATARPVPPTPPPRGEARRKTLPRLEGEAILSPHLAKLHAHFGDAKGPFLMQRVTLARGRVAVLVSLAPDEKNPIVIVIDHDAAVWVKERPTAGISPPVRGLALAPHPDGGAILFAFVPAVATVAGRIWADDGGAFADLEVLPLADCEALSAGYSPGLGWVIAAARRGGAARAQLVRETGTVAWGTGIDLGAAWRRAAPVAIGFDSPSTVVLSQFATTTSGDHLLAYRYDAGGRALWPAPVDLGTVAAVPKGAEWLEARSLEDGQVRLQAAPGILAGTVTVDSAGKILH